MVLVPLSLALMQHNDKSSATKRLPGSTGLSLFARPHPTLIARSPNHFCKSPPISDVMEYNTVQLQYMYTV